WVATAREAAKQSRRARLPRVAAPATTDDVVARIGAASVALVLDGAARSRLATVPLPDAGEVLLVVGPEGGLTPAELAAFEGAGAVPVRLGSTVLRTSTAGRRPWRCSAPASGAGSPWHPGCPWRPARTRRGDPGTGRPVAAP